MNNRPNILLLFTDQQRLDALSCAGHRTGKTRYVSDDRLPDDEKHTVESFAEAFNQAISGETTISPGKLSLKKCRELGGDLIGTVGRNRR